MNATTYRQGDVLVTRIDRIPANLKTVPRENGRVVLAHGEVTGHCHAIDAPEETVLFLAADLADLNERFLRITDEVQIVHEEHDTVTLPPGDYKVSRQAEYAPEEIRTVAD